MKSHACFRSNKSRINPRHILISGTVRPSTQQLYGHVSIYLVCYGLRFVRLHCISPNKHHASPFVFDRQDLQRRRLSADQRGMAVPLTTQVDLLHGSSANRSKRELSRMRQHQYEKGGDGREAPTVITLMQQETYIKSKVQKWLKHMYNSSLDSPY